jgi:hypothetical protein
MKITPEGIADLPLEEKRLLLAKVLCERSERAIAGAPLQEAPSELLSRDAINQRFAEVINSTSDVTVVYEDVLGEGPGGWDPNPRYPQKTVNCLVWPQLLISEIYGKDLSVKTSVMDRIRYYGGHVGFSLRKHFIDQWMAFEPEPLVRVNLNVPGLTERKQVKIDPKIFVDYRKFPGRLYKMDQTRIEIEYTTGDGLMRAARNLRSGYYIAFGVASETYIEKYGISSGPMGLVHPMVLKLDPMPTEAQERPLQSAMVYHASIYTECIHTASLESFVQRMEKLFLGYALYELDPYWDFEKQKPRDKETQELLSFESQIVVKRQPSTRLFRPAFTALSE